MTIRGTSSDRSRLESNSRQFNSQSKMKALAASMVISMAMELMVSSQKEMQGNLPEETGTMSSKKVVINRPRTGVTTTCMNLKISL